MASPNDINIRILADLGQLKGELQELRREVTSAGESVTGAFSGIGATLAKTGLAIQGFREGLRIAGEAMGFLVGATADFETLQTRLESLYGSADKAAQVFTVLSDVAATTPFELRDVVEAGVTLKAFGLDAEKTTKATADLAAFMGTTATEAAGALGRAFAGGAGAADILRERGILNLIKSFKGIDDLTKLSLPEFRTALLEAMSDPAAGIAGSTDRLSKTFSGAMSNMMDSISQFRAAFGKDLAASLKEMAISVTAWVTAAKDHIDALVAVLKVLVVLLAGAAAGFIAFKVAALGLDGILLALMIALDGVTAGLAAVQTFLLANPFTALATAVAMAATAIYLFGTTEEEAAGKSRDRTDALYAEADATRAVASGDAQLVEYVRRTAEARRQQAKEEKEAAEALAGSVAKLTAAQARQRLSEIDLISLRGEALKAGMAESRALRDHLKELEDAAKQKKALTSAEIKAQEKAYEEWVARDIKIGNLHAEAEARRQKKVLDRLADTRKLKLDILNRELEDQKKVIDYEIAADMDRWKRNVEAVKGFATALADGIGEAMAGAWTTGLSGMRDALKSMLLTILQAVEQLVLASKIAAVAEALVASGWNVAAGITTLLAKMPAIIGLEALFAALKIGVTRMEVGSGPISRPTLALLGEAASRSGKEVVVPEVPFVKWANQVLLPRIAGTGGDPAAHKLLQGIQDRLERVETALSGRRLGRDIGRELALAGRGRL